MQNGPSLAVPVLLDVNRRPALVRGYCFHPHQGYRRHHRQPMAGCFRAMEPAPVHSTTWERATCRCRGRAKIRTFPSASTARGTRCRQRLTGKLLQHAVAVLLRPSRPDCPPLRDGRRIGDDFIPAFDNPDAQRFRLDILNQGQEFGLKAGMMFGDNLHPFDPAAD